MADHGYQYDVVVVGQRTLAAMRGGNPPGAAWLKTAIVERESLGGVCLNWGASHRGAHPQRRGAGGRCTTPTSTVSAS